MEKKRDSFFLNKKSNKTENKGKQQKQPNKRQDEFDKNREVKSKSSLAKDEERVEKKPFDKKNYRLKKYSKKYKLEQWEEQRRKELIRGYQKELKNDTVFGTYKPISFHEDTTDSKEVGKYVRHPDIIEKENKAAKPKRDPFKRAKEQYSKIKQDREKKKEKMERIKEERNQKLQEYKKKKQERYKKLSKKTKKGQPIMTGRLELLLDKIQKS